MSLLVRLLLIFFFSFAFFRGNIVGVQPYTTGNPSCSTHGLSTSRRWPGLCDDGSVFTRVAAPEPVQPAYENVIPDSGYANYDQSAYSDSVSKYNQYEVANVNQYVAPTPKPQPVKIVPPPQPIRTQAQSQFSATDYTFSSFGFNRQPQQQQIPVVTVAPVRTYNFATTPKPVPQQQPAIQQRQEVKQHSAFYTYNWDSLFKNYYSYNTQGRK